MRKLKRSILAAYWAFFNADNLTMLKHEMKTDGVPDIHRGTVGSKKIELVYSRHASVSKRWAERYLGDLPID